MGVQLNVRSGGLTGRWGFWRGKSLAEDFNLAMKFNTGFPTTWLIIIKAMTDFMLYLSVTTILLMFFIRVASVRPVMLCPYVSNISLWMSADRHSSKCEEGSPLMLARHLY